MLISLLLAFQAASPLAARPDTTHPRHDALHYDLSISIPDSGTLYTATVAVRFRLESAEPVRLELDPSLRVTAAAVGGRSQDWKREAGWVILEHGRGAGDTVTTSVTYEGPAHDGLVVGVNPYGARTVFADNWPDRAHFWIASQDVPGDKATAAFHIEAPASQQAMANGDLLRVDTLAGGRRRRWHYRINHRIPVYTMVIAVGTFATTNLPIALCPGQCIPIAVVTYPQDSAFAVTGPFRRSGEIVEYFTSLIGPFPYDRLSHVESTTIFGGVENSTAIFYDAKAYAKRTLREETVAHETAHQWFGDAVTEADWHHLWLSEGFATYFAALWVEHTRGVASRDSTMRRDAAAVISSADTERPIIDPQATDLMKLLNSNNYPKGGWVLHSLRGMIGDTAFFRGVREYYRRYRDGTALSSDFARVMSIAAGSDLTWYFTQALTQPGYPRIDVRWRMDGSRLTIDLIQTQPDAWGAYRLPGLVIDVDGRTARVDMDGRHATTTLENVDRAPAKITVDPAGWWLLTYRVSP